MANSIVALTNPASQLAELQRRQKIAEALAAQGAEPIEVGSYKGIQAPISPLSGIAKVLQTYLGAKQQADILKERRGVEQKQNEAYSALGDFLSGNPNALGGGTPPAQSFAPVPNQDAVMESSVNASEPVATNMVAPSAAPEPMPMTAQPNAAPTQPAPGVAIANALMAGPTAMPPVEAAQTAMPTPQQAMRMDAPSLVKVVEFARKNGIDPSPYIEIAKLTQPDLINVNGFLVNKNDPSKAGKYYGGLGNGQQPTFDASGNVIGVTNIPGFVNSSAEVTRANTAATEAAKAQYGFTEVTNIDGSKSLVRNDILSGQLGPLIAPPATPAPGQVTQPAPTSNRGPTPQEQSVATAFSDAGAKLIIAAPDAAREARQQSLKAQQILKGVLKLDGNAFTDIKLGAERVADALGFTSAERTDFINNATSVKQMMGENVIPKAKQLGSNPSNYDAQMLNKIYGNINNPKLSNALMFATIVATQEKEADRQDYNANYEGPPNSREMEKAWAKSPRSERSIFQNPVFKTINSYGRPIVIEQVVKTGPHKGEKWGLLMPYNADGTVNKQAMHYKVIE
jgi:hypothetical protein